MNKLKTILLFLTGVLPLIVFSQTRFSLATGASVQRSFKEGQRYWAFGQDVVFNWHFFPRSGAYASVSYYSNGNFTNSLTAIAKSSSTIPQEIFFSNKAQLRLRQISIGWKYFLVGASDIQTHWNLYSVTGFGLIFGKATNTYSTRIDTTLYIASEQPIPGVGNFKRLTLDLGLGWEFPLSTDVFFYSEGKVWIPTSDYPSPYLLVNQNAPLEGMVTIGIRILF